MKRRTRKWQTCWQQKDEKHWWSKDYALNVWNEDTGHKIVHLMKKTNLMNRRRKRTIGENPLPIQEEKKRRMRNRKMKDKTKFWRRELDWHQFLLQSLFTMFWQPRPTITRCQYQLPLVERKLSNQSPPRHWSRTQIHRSEFCQTAETWNPKTWISTQGLQCGWDA